METLGSAARRLLAKMDARRAKEIDRDRLSAVRSAAPPCGKSNAQPAPDTGEGIGSKDRTASAMPRGYEFRLRLPLPHRPGEGSKSPRLLPAALAASNCNRPAGGAGEWGSAAGRSRAREEDCAEGVHDRTPYGEGSSFARDRSMESALRAWASDMPSAFAISSVSRPKRNRLYADGVH